MSSDRKFDHLNQQLFDEGVKMRRAVLGDEYVDRALNKATPYSMPEQELITRWAWGDVWQRPGLDRKQRSLLTIGLIIGQKAWLELALHTRGAINNGLSELEIREAVMHATVYCGTPAGVEAIAVTENVINDMIEKGEYQRPEPEAETKL
ncbi:AhpD-like protein [Aspergillus avenaceus]|uniref:AhpD-like protein n=1 Tax=Aspergillus avenaceus TaxID=36643 RepID=A0A5N6TSF9_ASPAV|nr:AhpD-like protein [Aspergillus avenaceus]